MLTLSHVAHAQLQPQEVSNFRLVDWGGNVFVDSFYYRETQRRPGTQEFEQNEVYSQQGVEVWGKGYVYHPNLLDWTGKVRVGFTVDNSDIGQGESGTNIGELLGYDFSGLVLKEKPVSAHVFGNLRHEFIGRTFTQPVQLDTDTEGFEVRYRGPIRAALLFDHHASKEDSEQRIDDEDALRTRLRLTDNSDRDRFNELIYEHEDVDESLRFSSPGSGLVFDQNLDEVRDEMNFRNRWAFGDGPLKNQLSGNARLLHRTGFFDQDLALVSQRLDLAHTPTLSSFYSGVFSYDDSDSQRERNLAGEVGLTKRFYESLVLTGRVNVSDRDYDDGLERDLGFFIDADYTKKTPIGQYRSHLTVGRRYEEESFEGGARRVQDESVSLSGIDFSTLNQPNVQGNTIVVTDANNGVLYVEGVDYELRQTGAITEVRRLVGGGIVEGQPVFVDYIAIAGNDSNFHRDTINWSNRLDLNFVPVALYMTYGLRNETLDSGDDPGNLERDQRWLFGSELLLGELTLAGEYERRSLRLTPSWDAYRARAHFVHRLSAQAYVSAGAHYEWLTYRDAQDFDFEPGSDFRESYGATANATAKIGRNLLLRFEAIYLKNRGRNNDELIRIGPSLTWNVGQMELTIGGYQAFYQQEDTEGDTTYAMVNFKRTF